MATRSRKAPFTPAPEDGWEPGTVYLRHLSSKEGGGGHITKHACWNMSLFIKHQHAAALEAGGLVEQVSEREFLKYKKQQQ